MKYGHPTLLRHPLWVSLESDKEVKFLLQPLSYSQVYGMNEYYYIKDKATNIEKYTPYGVLHSNIIDYKGAIGFSDLSTLLDTLSISDKEFLEYKLYELSALTEEQLLNIEELINIITEPALQDDSYSCAKCKLVPGRQEARNCPLLELTTKAKFKIRIGNTTHTSCPVASVDTYVANQIIQSNNFLSMNTQPLSGGLDNQSVWFVLVSQRYKARVNELRARQ